MKDRIPLYFLFGLTLAYVLAFVQASFAERPSNLQYRIFILHSYEKGNVCGQPQHDGILAALQSAGFREELNLEVGTYYMDSKRRNNTPKLLSEQARLAMEKIQSFKPHVLVTLDDNAFRTVALNLVDSSIGIVFSGMNGQPEDYNRTASFLKTREHPGHNITGVYEKIHIADAIKVHSRLFPGLKKIMIFVDISPTGQALTKQIGNEMEKEKVTCSWDLKTVKTWEGYKKALLAANRSPDVGAIYPAALLLKDGQGNTYTAPEIFAWTVMNSTKPEIALNYGFTRMGLFGGAAVDFYAMGSQAGRMVARHFDGQKLGDIPIEEADKCALVFNLKRAKQLGIEIPLDIIMAADEVVSDGRKKP